MGFQQMQGEHLAATLPCRPPKNVLKLLHMNELQSMYVFFHQINLSFQFIFHIWFYNQTSRHKASRTGCMINEYLKPWKLQQKDYLLFSFYHFIGAGVVSCFSQKFQHFRDVVCN